MSPGIFHMPRWILLFFSLAGSPAYTSCVAIGRSAFYYTNHNKTFSYSVQMSRSNCPRPKSNRAKRNLLCDPFSISYSDPQTTDYHNALGKLRFNDVVRVGGLLRSERGRPQQGTTRTWSPSGHNKCSHQNQVLYHLAFKHLQGWELGVNHEDVSV